MFWLGEPKPPFLMGESCLRNIVSFAVGGMGSFNFNTDQKFESDSISPASPASPASQLACLPVF